MKTLKEQIAVMQAEDEGEQIEILPLDGSYPCEDKTYQAYDWNRNDYRVKPKLMEITITINDYANVSFSLNSEVYRFSENNKGKTIKFIQAPDDEQ